MSIEEQPIKSETAREAWESGSHKKRAELDEMPLAWAVYLILGGLAGLYGFLTSSGAPFFLGLGFLALAELVVIRRGSELAARRARQRMGWPPTDPPLRDGASEEEKALAWAAIACRASAQGQHERAEYAWKKSDEAMRRPGAIDASPGGTA